jgi:Zn-dependent membrane protease YugP
MTEAKMIVIIFLLGMALEAVAFLGLAALGANNSILFLAVILPLALTAYASSWVVTHFDESGPRQR